MIRSIFLYSYPRSLYSNKNRSLIQYLYSIYILSIFKGLSLGLRLIQYKRAGLLSVFTLCSGLTRGWAFYTVKWAFQNGRGVGFKIY